MPRALILGATGQDGQFLADFLLRKNYEVLGVSRSNNPFKENQLSLRRPAFKSVDISNATLLKNVLDDFNPDEIYNLAGESSVSKSFKEPSETVESNVVGVVNLLTTVMQNPNLRHTRVFQASSAEMFGSSSAQLNELSPFNPVSPYSVSKLAAHKISQSFRQDFGTRVSCGILFNHESELRPSSFVFQKIITTAVAISKGETNKLTLGNLDIFRDWGYAKDYVEAMWKILQAEIPDDYIVATGEKHSLRELIELTFSYLNIDSNIDNLIIVDPSLSRPSDVEVTWGAPSKIKANLGWRASTDFSSLIKRLIDFQLARTS
jgi:GDPmannose 4,6-dehydratase